MIYRNNNVVDTEQRLDIQLRKTLDCNFHFYIEISKAKNYIPKEVKIKNPNGASLQFDIFEYSKNSKMLLRSATE